MSYSQPLINQPRLLLLSIGMGMLLGALYVVIQGASRLLGDGKLSYYIADGIFSVVFALASFFFMVIYNEGRVRLHLILGEGAGFAVFYFAAGKYAYSFIEKGAKVLRKAMLILWRPYRIIFCSFISGMKRLWVILSEKKFYLIRRNSTISEEGKKSSKKINLFGKIHLKNPDK